jgi:hypothetical protein
VTLDLHHMAFTEEAWAAQLPMMRYFDALLDTERPDPTLVRKLLHSRAKDSRSAGQGRVWLADAFRKVLCSYEPANAARSGLHVGLRMSSKTGMCGASTGRKFGERAPNIPRRGWNGASCKAALPR